MELFDGLIYFDKIPLFDGWWEGDWDWNENENCIWIETEFILKNDGILESSWKERKDEGRVKLKKFLMICTEKIFSLELR